VKRPRTRKKVLVLGDFTAGQMAKGLTEAYVETPGWW
jgi:hypothetical protein